MLLKVHTHTHIYCCLLNKVQISSLLLSKLCLQHYAQEMTVLLEYISILNTLLGEVTVLSLLLQSYFEQSAKNDIKYSNTVYCVHALLYS